MPTRTGKQNSEINVFGAVLGDAFLPNLGAQNIIVAANGNNPPTVKQYTSFYVYGTDTFTSPTSPATGNAVYPANTSLTYLLASVISEPADQTFAWGTAAGATSAGIPSKSNSTVYYLFCSGSQDVDSTSRGKGLYGVSTNAPTWSDLKQGWYSSDGRVLAKFTTDGSGNVTLNAVYTINSYSLVEQVTNKFWVDGRRIYRKVINVGTLPNNTSKSTAHGLTVSSTFRFIKMYGWASNGSTATSWKPLPYVDQNNGSTYQISIDVDNTNVVIYTHYNATALTDCYVVLEYVY